MDIYNKYNLYAMQTQDNVATSAESTSRVWNELLQIQDINEAKEYLSRICGWIPSSKYAEIKNEDDILRVTCDGENSLNIDYYKLKERYQLIATSD